MSGYNRKLAPTKAKFYTVTGDETAITSIKAYIHSTNAIRVDALFTPVVIDKGVCVMPIAYTEQYDTNPAINIHVAHNSFINGYNMYTHINTSGSDSGSNKGEEGRVVLVAGLRQILHTMSIIHTPQHISPHCTSLSSLSDWKDKHIATHTTIDEPLNPNISKVDSQTKKTSITNRINSPGTIKLAVLVPSRDNRSDDVIKVPLLSMEVMQKQNDRVNHALLRSTIYAQRNAEEKSNTKGNQGKVVESAKMKADFVPNIMYNNDNTLNVPEHISVSSTNGLFELWNGRQRPMSHINSLHSLGYNYNGMLDTTFYTYNGDNNPSILRDCSNPEVRKYKNKNEAKQKYTVKSEFGQPLHLKNKDGKFTSLSHLCQSTVTRSMLYSESTTLAELQMAPLGSLVESIKDTLLSVRRYYQQNDNSLEVGGSHTSSVNNNNGDGYANGMPFPPTIFNDVPVIQVTLYIAVDLNDKMWDDPTMMHKFRLVTNLLIGDLPINIKFINRVHGYRGAPNWIWGELARTAYDEGNDYFLQVNDDVTFHHKHWLLPLIYDYRNRPIPDFGVIGLDLVSTARLFTQMLFSYRYVEVMNGYSFPGYTNWYGDDFVSRIFAHYPQYNTGFITPDVFNNEKGRYTGVSHNRNKVHESSAKQRYRFYKYLTIHFPDHPDTKEFVTRSKKHNEKSKISFLHTFLNVY